MQLAIAVALSAQTTDKKVNEITAKLFKKYKSWEDFANSNIVELTEDIKGVNFHKGKAVRLQKMGKVVIENFGGELPRTIAELITLPGVAKKTANVITQELWDVAYGIVVDTHVTRLSNRLGLTSQQDAKKIEIELMEVIPRENWRNFSGALVLHGRYVCKARKPECSECIFNKVCPSAFSFD